MWTLPCFFSLSKGRVAGMNISISSGTFLMIRTAHNAAWKAKEHQSEAWCLTVAGTPDSRPFREGNAYWKPPWRNLVKVFHIQFPPHFHKHILSDFEIWIEWKKLKLNDNFEKISREFLLMRLKNNTVGRRKIVRYNQAPGLAVVQTLYMARYHCTYQNSKHAWVIPDPRSRTMVNITGYT